MNQLKLLAMDDEDLKVVSAHCQDAVLKIGDLDYIPSENRFLITMNRFVWENLSGTNKTSAKKTFERRQSLIAFSRVNSVRVSGINRGEKDMVLSLLAITFEPADAPAGEIELVFAGDGAIRLGVECIECQLTDTAAAWETKSLPTHD